MVKTIWGLTIWRQNYVILRLLDKGDKNGSEIGRKLSWRLDRVDMSVCNLEMLVDCP